jgi:hypothetical protein
MTQITVFPQEGENLGSTCVEIHICNLKSSLIILFAVERNVNTNNLKTVLNDS